MDTIMTKLLSFLSRTLVIIVLFLLSTLIMYSFSFFREALGGQFLDMIYTADGAQTLLDTMSGDQKSAHIKATLLLDILFPLTLGGYLLGIAARVTPKLRKWAILPAIIAIITDLCENTVQVLALKGHTDLLFLKTYLTPVKYAAFYTALILALFLILIGLVKWFKSRAK